MLNDVSYLTRVTGPLMLGLIKQFLSGWAIYGALELSFSLGFTRKIATLTIQQNILSARNVTYADH